jgi:tryptophan synthase alpha chain
MLKLSQTNSREDSPIASKFKELHTSGDGALITYLTGGDPNPDSFEQNVATLVGGGADIIEIGIPFSDPIADGPVIQASSQRALRAGATIPSILSQVERLSSAHDLPFVILTYYNPILAFGAEAFCRLAKESGVDGLVIADLPEGEDPDFHRLVLSHGIDHIPIAAPNTSKERLESILANATGFVYLVSLYGVTGVRDTLGINALESLERLRSINRPRVPLCAGFGISTVDHIKALMSAGADGVIVGSTLVTLVNDRPDGSGRSLESLRRKVSELKQATRKSLVAIEA